MTSNVVTQNTISPALNREVTLYNNSIEIIGALANSMIQNQTTVSLALKDSQGNIVNITLPSLVSLDADIKRLEKNIEQLSGINSTAYIRNSDGSYNKIITSKKTTAPDQITGISVPVEFNRKNNWFFENFLSPLLFINFDLTNLIEPNVNKIAVKRFILNLDTETKLTNFRNALEGRNDLQYEDVILFLNSQNISYFIDDDIYDIPASILRYEGKFGVVSTYNETTSSGTIKHYKFTTLKYTDNISTYKNSKTLKVGDVLSLDDTTRFEILTIDEASRDVTLKRISGNRAIPLGDNILSLESRIYTSKEISVNIGYDEKQIIFLSAINTEQNIASTKYSPGVCFDSNSLVFRSTNGQEITLEEYYRKEVVDFGMHIMNLSKDRQIPSISGIIPDAPILNESDFEVVQINNHLSQDTLTEDIKTKISEKTRVKNELQSLDRELRKNLEIIRKTTRGSAEYSKYEEEIKKLLSNKKGKIEEYNALTTDLSLIYRNNPKDSIRPKFRIRGFWPYPEPKYNSRTGNQEVIQFKIEYRYLSTNGNTADAKKFNITNNDSTIQEGYFSPWIQYETKPRKKYYDIVTDEFKWDSDDPKNIENINTNQLDIPIQRGEIVEIRIQSVSEAGYPANPLISEFSNTVRITFPESLEDDNDLYRVLEESAREDERAILYRQLDEYGLERHLRDTQIVNNIYYAHHASDLNSGLIDSAGNIRSVFDVLNSLQNEIADLKKQINSQSDVEIRQGKLRVIIEGKDRYGNMIYYPVQNSGTVELTPPSYFSVVSSRAQSERRGAIIKETYNLILENVGNGPLNFVSKYPGALYEELPVLSGNNLTWRNTSFVDEEYRNNRLYSKVPIKYSNYTTYESIAAANDRFGFSTQQSKQVAGQFIYSRYKNITGTKNLYSAGTPKRANVTSEGTSNKRSFVWNGTYYNPISEQLVINNNVYSLRPNGGGTVNTFSVHFNHPDVINNRMSYNELNPINILSDENKLEHADFFNIEKAANDYNVQMEVTQSSNNKFQKFGFLDNDRFLIGEDTTGMYLYLNPSKPEDIRVNGTDSLASLELQPGEKKIIPITVEYRMTDYFDEGDAYSSINNKVVNAQENNNAFSISKTQYLGVVGGYSSTNLSRQNINIEYEKTIGLDIFTRNNTVFSFDVKVNAIYGSSKNTLVIKNDTIDVNDTRDIIDINKDFIKIDNGGTSLVVVDKNVFGSENLNNTRL